MKTLATWGMVGAMCVSAWARAGANDPLFINMTT